VKLHIADWMTDFPNIALRAYQLWDAAGRPEGRSDAFYFAAEEELRQLIEKQMAVDTEQSLQSDEHSSKNPPPQEGGDICQE